MSTYTIAAIRSGMRSLAAYPLNPVALWTTSTGLAGAASMARWIASTWSEKWTFDRSASADSRPGRVRAVTS